MFQSYLELGLVALLPSVTTAIFVLIEKKKKIKIASVKMQILIGVLFGLLAVLGTEFGIPINGAQVNCRDAAVLSAGLFFGAPAGIIAGLIGGIERWFAVYWGVGSFTRVACSVSTIIAGFVGAFLRKFMFENKAPKLYLTFVVGIVVEVFHMNMVFITNMATPDKAITVVKSCSAIMIGANALSVTLAGLFLLLINGNKRLITDKKTKVAISQTIQRGLLVAVLIAFVGTTSFVLMFQQTMSDRQIDSLLSLATDETSQDIIDESDANLLQITWQVEYLMRTNSLETVMSELGVDEINVVDKDGFIIQSSDKSYIGLNFKDYEESKDFCVLLGNVTEYVQEYRQNIFDKAIVRKYCGVKTNDGFVQVGYDSPTLQKNIDSLVVNITKNRHVGETGSVIILDSSMNVISAPTDFPLKNLSRTDSRIELPDQDTTYKATIAGTEYFCRYHISEGYYIFSLLPTTEAMQSRDVAVYINMYLQIIVYAVLFVLIYSLIKLVVVKQLKKVNHSLAKITDGNLDEVVNVRTNQEFESLSDDINSTVDTLKKYIAEAAARIDKELEFAKNIQESALPSNFNLVNATSNVEIFASMNAAKEVGGDFYDFYFTKDGNFNFLIADVSGKGIPASLFMMRAKTELKSLTEAGLPLNEVFTQGNVDLCEGNEAGMFVTAWQGNIDLKTGLVHFANAGHNPPIVRKNNGKFELLKMRAGLVLAGMDGIEYKEQQIELEPGDIIYLYTDGVTEATNLNDELFGEERLLNALNAKEFDSVEELCLNVRTEIDAFVGEAPQFDDITMVAFRFKNNE